MEEQKFDILPRKPETDQGHPSHPPEMKLGPPPFAEFSKTQMVSKCHA